MAKKKSSKPMAKKKQRKLATTFQCLFCNHPDVVTVKMDKKAGIGKLNCSKCGQSFETVLMNLSKPVDVFFDWVDACDAVAKEEAERTRETDARTVAA